MEQEGNRKDRGAPFGAPLSFFIYASFRYFGDADSRFAEVREFRRVME